MSKKYTINKKQSGGQIQNLNRVVEQYPVPTYSFTPQGQQIFNQYEQAGYDNFTFNPQGTQVNFERPTGMYDFNPAFKSFNLLAQLITGVANKSQDIKDSREEYKQFVQSLQPKSYESTVESGLNDLPIYTQTGGRATTADSLAVYNAQMNQLRHYGNGNFDSNRSNDTNSLNRWIRYIESGNVNKGSINTAERTKKAILNENGAGFQTDRYRKTYGLTPNQILNKIDKAVNVYNNQNTLSNQIKYQDLVTPAIDFNSPFAIYDKRIKPQGTVTYSPHTEQVPGQEVETFYYDPIAVKPYNMLTPKEKAIRDKKYPQPRVGQELVKGPNIRTNPRPEIPLNPRIPKTNISVESQETLSNNPTFFKGFQRPQFVQNKTKYSYTFPTGPYNEHQTIYFKNEKEWKDFTKGLSTSSQSGKDWGTATGPQMQMGGNLDAANLEAKRIAKARGLANAENVYVDQLPQYVNPDGTPYKPMPAKPLPRTLPQGITPDMIQTDGSKYWYDNPYTGDTIDLDPSIIRLAPQLRTKKTGGCAECGGYVKAQNGFDQVSGVSKDDNPLVEAEDGEVIQALDGTLKQVEGNSHEEGGELLNDVQRVLEDTSTSRKDKDSKTLKLSPEMAELLTGYKPKKDVSHSEAIENYKKESGKKLDKIEKALEKNVKSLTANSNNPYAKNSMDMNLRNLDQIPTEGDVFDSLFDHQEFVKFFAGIKPKKAQYGGKYQVAQVGAGVIDSMAKKLDDPSGWELLYTRGNRTYYKKEDGQVVSVPGTKIDIRRGGKEFSVEDIINQPDKYQTFHQQMQGADDATKRKAAEDLFYRGVMPPKYVDNRNTLYGYTETNPRPPVDAATPLDRPVGTPTTQRYNTNIPQPKSRFFEPLNWFDVAGPIDSLLSSTSRIPVRYNPMELNQLRLKQQNPLPALQQGQTDYNAALDTLPNNTIGYSNTANLFSKKYALDNQILGQYENANAQIKNQEITYNTNVRDRQSAADQQAREVFERKYLGSKEAQRQQRMTAMNELYTRLAQNRKLNREGNLLMSLFPAFDQYGEYNGYRYQFRPPMNFPRQ